MVLLCLLLKAQQSSSCQTRLSNSAHPRTSYKARLFIRRNAHQWASPITTLKLKFVPPSTSMAHSEHWIINRHRCMYWRIVWTVAHKSASMDLHISLGQEKPAWGSNKWKICLTSPRRESEKTRSYSSNRAWIWQQLHQITPIPTTINWPIKRSSSFQISKVAQSWINYTWMMQLPRYTRTITQMCNKTPLRNSWSIQPVKRTIVASFPQL